MHHAIYIYANINVGMLRRARSNRNSIPRLQKTLPRFVNQQAVMLAGFGRSIAIVTDVEFHFVDRGAARVLFPLSADGQRKAQKRCNHCNRMAHVFISSTALTDER